MLFPQFTAVGAPSVALTGMARDLGVSFAATAWVLAGWGLTAALAMPVGGRLLPRLGTRTVLVGAVGLVIVGSMLAALAPSLELVVAGRLFGGLGAGGTLIATYAALQAVTEPADRPRALGVLAGVTGLSSGSGTLIGGAITAAVGWRGAVAVSALVVLFVVPAVRLASGRRERRSDAGDPLGALLLMVLGGSVVTVLQASSTDLPTVLVVALLAAAGISGAALVAHVRRRPDGFVPRAVVTADGFWPASVIGMSIFAAYYAVLYAAPASVEAATGWSSLAVGAAMMPAGLCSVLATGALSSLEAERRPVPRVVAVLIALSVAGLLIAAAVGASVLVVLAVALTIGAFAGAQAVLVSLVPRLVADRHQAAAGGLFSFFAYGGGAIGPAAMGGLSSVVPLGAAHLVVAVLPAGAAIAVTRLGRAGSQR